MYRRLDVANVDYLDDGLSAIGNFAGITNGIHIGAFHYYKKSLFDRVR